MKFEKYVPPGWTPELCGRIAVYDGAKQVYEGKTLGLKTSVGEKEFDRLMKMEVVQTGQYFEIHYIRLAPGESQVPGS